MLSDDVKGYSVPGGQIRLIGIPCRKTYWDPIQSPFSWNIKVIPLTGNPGESCCEKFSPVGFVTGWYLNSYRQKRRNIIYNEKMGQACIVIRKFVNRWLTDLPISNGGSLNRNDMLFFFFWRQHPGKVLLSKLSMDLRRSDTLQVFRNRITRIHLK